MSHAAQRTAFVFAGGGSLGAVQVGMLRELMHAGVSADLVLGSSVGAMNAAYFAGAAHAAGVNELEEVWRGLRRHDVFPVTFRSVLGFVGGADNLIDPSNLRKLIERNIPFANLEDAPIPVHVVATNLGGVAICLSSGPAVEALLASAAIPAAFHGFASANIISLMARSGATRRFSMHRSGCHSYYRSSDGIRLRSPRAANGSNRARFACDHVAYRPSNGTRSQRAWRESRCFHRTQSVPA
jgi:hypothetical protein